MEQDQIRLTDILAPAFYPVHRDVKAGRHTYYDLYGGRGSCKSSFISVEIVSGIMQDPEANAIVFRKVASTIGTSVFEQVLWAINALGVSHLWKYTVSPYKCVYIPTGQAILFRGLDYAKKIKSIKVAKGYIKYAWFEELDEYNGDEEIRSVQQSVLRGGTKHFVFKSFNPPISKSNWANKYVLKPRGDAYRHKSCYLDVNPEWLGRQFLDDADELRRTNYRAYQHEYLGDAVGTGGEVFSNLELRTISDEEAQKFDNIFMGIDWGYYPDPFQWTKLHYDPRERILYIFDELRLWKASTREQWEAIRDRKGVTGYDLITSDSSPAQTVGDFRAFGSLCRPTIKSGETRKYSYQWLQSMKKIVIDPVRCPYSAKEFSECEYERTKDDEIVSRYPDVNDHAIDSVRYAMTNEWKRKGR